MAKGGFPGGRMGGGNMMRQQAQMQQKLIKMQKEIEEKQAEIEATLYTATVGGGAVKAVCTGKKEWKKTGVAWVAQGTPQRHLEPTVLLRNERHVK